MGSLMRCPLCMAICPLSFRGWFYAEETKVYERVHTITADPNKHPPSIVNPLYSSKYSIPDTIEKSVQLICIVGTIRRAGNIVSAWMHGTVGYIEHCCLSLPLIKPCKLEVKPPPRIRARWWNTPCLSAWPRMCLCKEMLQRSSM